MHINILFSIIFPITSDSKWFRINMCSFHFNNICSSRKYNQSIYNQK